MQAWSKFSNQLTVPQLHTKDCLFAVTCTVHDYQCDPAQLHLLHSRACFHFTTITRTQLKIVHLTDLGCASKIH